MLVDLTLAQVDALVLTLCDQVNLKVEEGVERERERGWEA
jgi:hypothetical protein